MSALPWDDCKIAFAITSADDLWAARDAGKLNLPTGWELTETDGSSGRVIAIFRVNVAPSPADGRKVLAVLTRLRLAV